MCIQGASILNMPCQSYPVLQYSTNYGVVLSVPFYSLKTNVYIVIVKFRARHFITIMCRASERASIKVKAFFIFRPSERESKACKKIANI